MSDLMQNEEKKKIFSERLNKALDQRNFPPKNLGRVSLLAEMFSMTHKGAGNWVNAKSIPPAKKLDEICEKLDISKEWLVFGEDGISTLRMIKIPVIKIEDIINDNLPNGSDTSSYLNFISVEDSNSKMSFSIDLQDNEFEIDFILSNKAKLIFDPKKKIEDKLFALIKKDKQITISRLIEYDKNKFAIKIDSLSQEMTFIKESDIIRCT